ncbi:hypothetical protein MRX96_028319 [Rhipicephalus microplus]
MRDTVLGRMRRPHRFSTSCNPPLIVIVVNFPKDNECWPRLDTTLLRPICCKEGVCAFVISSTRSRIGSDSATTCNWLPRYSY